MPFTFVMSAGPSGPPPVLFSGVQIPAAYSNTITGSFAPYARQGDSLTLEGMGFTDATDVLINGVSTPFVIVNDNTITVTSLPAHTFGSWYEARVVNASGPSDPINVARCSRWRTLAHNDAFQENSQGRGPVSRSSTSTVLLDDGKILMVGGSGSGNTFDRRRCFLYDPTTFSWSETGSLIDYRSGASAVKLTNGKVLYAGGQLTDSAGNIGSLPMATTAELYDPVAGTWSATGSTVYKRDTAFNGSMVALSNGKALLIGDPYQLDRPGNTNTDSTQAFTLNGPIHSGMLVSWTKDGGFRSANITNAGVVSGDPFFSITSATVNPTTGEVSLTFGFGKIPDTNTIGFSYEWYKKSELYDPTSNTFGAAADVPTVRQRHPRIVTLSDGNIFVVATHGSTVKASLYDVDTNTWISRADPPTDWTDSGSVALCALPSDNVMLAGGIGTRIIEGSPLGGLSISTVAIYDQVGDAWTPGPSLSEPLSTPHLCLLASGKVQRFGGIDNYNVTPSWRTSVEQYDESTNTWTARDAMPGSNRPTDVNVWDRNAVLVDGDTIYVIGGDSGNSGTNTGEIQQYRDDAP